MSANSLYDNIRGYLRVSARVVKKVGDLINEKEQFTLRITVSNTAYSGTPVGNPWIIFRGAQVYVEGTAYAAPSGGNTWHNLPDAHLYPGEATHVDVQFTAKHNMGGIPDWFLAESVAKVWVKADLDQNRFFEVWNYKSFSEEIAPT